MRDEEETTPLIKGHDNNYDTTTSKTVSPQAQQEGAGDAEPGVSSDTSSTGSKAIISVLILGTISPSLSELRIL